MRLNSTPFGAPPGAPATTRSSTPSPRIEKSRTLITPALTADRRVAVVERPVLWRVVHRRRIHSDPHLAAHHFGVRIGESEQRPCVVTLDIEQRRATARAGAPTHVALDGRVDAKLAI